MVAGEGGLEPASHYLRSIGAAKTDAVLGEELFIAPVLVLTKPIVNLSP